MRNVVSAPPGPPFGARWELGVTVVSAIVAYGLLVLDSALTVGRLIDAAPPEIVAGLVQSAIMAGLAP